MNMLRRVLALLGVALLLGLVIMTFVLGLTGSRYFMASLFAMIVIPVFIYGYMIIFRVISSRQREKMEESMAPGTESEENE